ncbi:hypothetical protein SETIT_9G062000v2 [Setaria italica]|uniref:Alpha/beta hydrolase fold-3 domain-containing protein n=2 Tax=Setaria TaxID=4554 RepID=K4AJT7_SETIT|nr:hypothetical protein SETIT_9G062000v2 [Setaria italica]
MSSTSAEAATVSGDAAPHVVADFAGMAQLLSDGTFVRHTDAASALPPASSPSTSSAQWKDVAYDPDHDLKLRMYRPDSADDEAASEKLPVLVYFHGGGFCVGSFSLPNTHVSCLRLAGELPAIVLSADYRLAPENRLPAAHDDARTLVSWMRNQAASPADADPWLAESADFGRVFVTGDSAGGNIAHHVAVAVGSGMLGVSPARVAGYVLFWPFFAGVERTASEAEYPPGPFLTLTVSDQFLRLSLPSEGDTRDHPAVNPFGPDSPPLGGVALPPTLVVAAGRDLLRDRVAGYAARLRAMGKPVELVEFQGEHHGFFIVEPWGDAGDELIRVVRRFVYGSTSCN